MKALIASLSVLAVLLFVLLLAVLGFAWQGQRRLATDNANLKAELAETRLALDAAVTEHQATTDRLTSLESTAAGLESELKEVKASAKAAEETLPRPYRVRTFLGKDSLGEAWMIPQNIKRDPASGRYVFEPVLLLDESNRNRFTVHHTNFVQTEILTTDYTPYDYGYPYYYGTWYPGIPGGTNQPPVNPQPPGPMPPMSSTPGYGNVSASARVFAPPFSIVNTRPQVLGRPATSGANARVFAP
jgi:type II secretory pathway pseudopilin PulG